MIAIIRISGIPEVPRDISETMFRLGLRAKFKCVLLHENPTNMGMIQKIRSFTAYGKIDEKTLAELIKARGKTIANAKTKIEADKIAKALLESKVDKKLTDYGLKIYFSLHPARGGIKSKLHFPKGVLGDHGDKINDLIRRML